MSLKGRRLHDISVVYFIWQTERSEKKHSGPDTEPSGTPHDDACSHWWKAELGQTVLWSVSALKEDLKINHHKIWTSLNLKHLQ